MIPLAALLIAESLILAALLLAMAPPENKETDQ